MFIVRNYKKSTVKHSFNACLKWLVSAGALFWGVNQCCWTACSKWCSSSFEAKQQAMIKWARLLQSCSRIRLHLLLQKGRLIISESAFPLLGVPSVLFHPNNRKQAILIAIDSVSEAQEKRDTCIPTPMETGWCHWPCRKAELEDLV